MARTALMGLLRRLIGEHEEADRLKIPVEALREARARQRERAGSVDRRTFLTGAAVATAALAVPRRARAASGGPRIAIVGAGIAGLSASLTLSDAGYASTVYESSGRVGGRMFSNMSGYWADGQVSEWGGELIDTQHVTMQALAKRFNLPLDDLHAAEPVGSTETYYFGGKYYSAAQAVADFDPVYKALQNDRRLANYPTLYNSSTDAGRALDAMSIAQWIDSRVPGGHGSPLGQLLDDAYVIEYGAACTDQSSLNLVYLLGFQPNSSKLTLFGKSDERYHVRGGNQQIPMAIASYLNNVQTSMRLVAIATNSDGTYTLTFRNGNATKTVVADLVVMAMPFAAMSGVDYSKAGFDALKVTAITQLGAARNGKLQLQFKSALWNQNGPWGLSNGTSYGDTGYQNTWHVSRAQPGASAVMVDYTGAGPTLAMNTKTAWAVIDSNKDVNTDAKRFLGQIEPIFPGLSALWNGKATSSIPHLDPNFGLSYSYWKVGQYTQFSGYEKVRQGNIFFAGEHCSQDFQGFMEGGATEGNRAANEIIAQLKH
jgi:monoamine oxidase